MSSSSSTSAGAPMGATTAFDETENYGENVVTSSNAKDIFVYLLTLPPEDLDSLYTGHVNTCKAVFRNLPPLAKQYVLRLMLFDRPVPLVNLAQVLVKSPMANAMWKESLDSLLRLRIMLKSTNVANNNAIEVQLNPNFRETFLQCMGLSGLDGSDSGSAGDVDTSKQDRKAPSLEFLREFSTDRWETVLKYMVGAVDPQQVDFGVKKLLEWSGLAQIRDKGIKTEDQSDAMVDDDDENNGESMEHTVTKDGFQFMLQDTRSQVWTLLREYLNTAQNRLQKKNEILQFLFELSFSIPGKAYMVKPLTKTQKVALRDFVGMFGLVYMRKERSKYYYPTPLATGILTNTGNIGPQKSLGMASETDAQHGYIIVETNFRVYAYTRSALQTALLYMFVSLEYNMPNMVVGMITRESIRTALMHGITAEQILGYLYLHAHPQMKANKPVIPETIADQIRLWEKERNRLEMFDAYVYDKFPNMQAFQLVEQYAKQIGAFLWSSQAKMSISCRAFAHEKIRDYIRKFL